MLDSQQLIFRKFKTLVLVQQEADIDGISINPDAEQLKIVDIPYPVIMTPFRMIVPAPVEESRLFAFVRPFQPMVTANKFRCGVCIFQKSF